MNKSIFIITCCLFAATSFVACTDSNSEGEIELPTAPTTPDTPDTPNQPSDDNYTEQYRPQIHFYILLRQAQIALILIGKTDFP